MGEGYGALQWGGGGGRLPVEGGGGNLMTHCVVSVTLTFKYVKVSDPYKNIFGRYEKTDFSTTVIFCSITFQSQCIVINHAVCKLGFKISHTTP
jgi:hypothetical protein